MAGYMTKLQGYLYEGEYVNGETNPIENGVLVVIDRASGKMKLPGSADTTSKFTCKEVTTIYGKPAYRFIVEKLDGNYYFVENGYEFNDAEEYDLTLYSTKPGKFLRAHPLLVGEEFVTDKVTGTIAANTQYGVKADGTIG